MSLARQLIAAWLILNQCSITDTENTDTCVDSDATAGVGTYSPNVQTRSGLYQRNLQKGDEEYFIQRDKNII